MLKFRQDRDLIDVLTLILAGIAVVSSIVFPLAIRSCDKKSMIPDISIHVTHMYPLTLEHYPDIINKIMHTWSFIKHLERISVESDTSMNALLPDILPDLTHFRLYSVTFTNRKNFPVGLNNLRVNKNQFVDPATLRESMHENLIGKSDGFMFMPIVKISSNLDQIQAIETISLKPNEIKTIIISIGVILHPSTESYELMHQETRKLLTKYLKTGQSLSEDELKSETVFRRNDHRSQHPKTILEALNPQASKIILKPIYREYALRKGFERISLTVTDYLGQDFYSNEVTADVDAEAIDE